MGLEHHLGMTCDPVCGLVQIPCIERNAYAAARALDANIYATFTDGTHRVSFDKVVEVMKQTGHDIPSLYKETGEGRTGQGLQPDGGTLTPEQIRRDARPVCPSATKRPANTRGCRPDGGTDGAGVPSLFSCGKAVWHLRIFRTKPPFTTHLSQTLFGHEQTKGQTFGRIRSDL